MFSEEESYNSLKDRLERENWQIAQFERLGLGLHDSVKAVDEGIDWHEVENFLKEHPACKPETALEIVR
jgi:hypothetical protein